MDNYEKQAIDFLKSTSTEFDVEFKARDRYFDHDKQSRDIYTVTLTRGNRKYSFEFGQSISNAGIEPTPYDVLACIQKHDVGSFEDFCAEFGYDTDSRRAEKIYHAVCDEYKNVAMLWNENEVEQLIEIQ